MNPNRLLAILLLLSISLLLTACPVTDPVPIKNQTPNAPSNVELLAGRGAITISWNDNSNNEESFLIYRATSNEPNNFVLLATIDQNKTSYTDLDVNINLTYSYGVSSKRQGRESELVKQTSPPVSPLPNSNEPILTVQKLGVGNGTIISSPDGISCGSTCEFKFENDQEITLTAQAASDSTFVGWGGDCSSSGSNATCNVTISEAKLVTAIFNSEPLELSVSISPDPVAPDSDLTYELILTNRDTSVLADITLDWLIPAKLYGFGSGALPLPIGSSCVGGGVCSSGRTLRWVIDSLLPGEAKTFIFAANTFPESRFSNGDVMRNLFSVNLPDLSTLSVDYNVVVEVP